MVSFKSLLLSKINNFRGGQLEKHVRQRRKLTNDPNILSIRFLAKVIDTIVSVFSAGKYAPLYYRALENDKIGALEILKGDFDSHHPISDDAKDDLKWWRNNNQMENWIHPPIIDTELFCDASDFAWGGVFETKPTGGAWSETEREYHIN